MKTRLSARASQLFIATSFAALASGAQAVTITVTCSSGPTYDICRQQTDAWAKKSGHQVKLFTTPSSTSDDLALLRQMFAAKSSDIDVIDVDVIWPGVLKDHLIDLKPYTKGAEAAHFPAVVANNTVNGKLLAMPSYTDAGMLFYRKDLLAKYGLKPPTSWEDMAESAKKIQAGERAAGVADFQGLVFQAKAYEGLTCDAMEWIASFGGGRIIDADGKVTVNNPNAALALKTVASWVGTIAPTGVLNYSEEDSRGVFQNGKAAFMRNWPYAWSLAQGADSLIKGKVGVMAPPKGGSAGLPAATLGGWQFAVSKYSKNPEVAADLVMFRTSLAMQKDNVFKQSLNPTIVALYKDKEVLAANPLTGSLSEVFTNAVARPSTVTGAKYPEVSAAIWNAVHDVISGKTNAEDGVKKLDARLNQIKRGQW
jgi:trehalose/maltose transport system substrate-binding protein